jgi:DNA-binding FadR family transcriptional regulator
LVNEGLPERIAGKRREPGRGGGLHLPDAWLCFKCENCAARRFVDMCGTLMRRTHGKSLTFGLLESLGQSIVAGEFDTTPFPTEADLALRFSASRTVAREAVKMLAAKGLLTSRPRQGTRVEPVAHWNLLDPDVTRWMQERPFTSRVYRDYTEVRLAIEPIAAALAAKRASPADIRAIRSALQTMEAEAHHHDLALLADIDFHVAILKASGNPFLIQLKELIHTALTISIALTNRIAGHTADIGDHAAVLTAIEQGDSAAAEKAMRHLISESLDFINSMPD